MKLHVLWISAMIGLAGSAVAQSGQVLNLNGVDGRMEVADADALDIDAGESFSITLWMKTAQNADYFRVVSKREAGSGAGYEMITQSGAGAFGINLRSTAGTNAGPPFGTTSVTDGSWHHLAMVVNAASGSASIYVDGNLEQAGTSAAIGTESFATATDLLLGTNVDGNFHLNGSMDDVRVWQTALSAAQVAADMTATVDGSTPDLVAAWDFENVNGTTVPDVLGAHPGTLLGGASVVMPGGDMSFTGSNVIATSVPVGIGEQAERVIGIRISTTGQGMPLSVSDVSFNLNGTTDLADLGSVEVFYTGGSPRMTTDMPFGTVPAAAGTIQVSGFQELQEGDNYFWVTCTVSADAQEGHVIKGELVSVTGVGQDYTPAITSTDDQRMILLEHKLLYSSGDYGAANWRIPAIIRAADGSLVAVADKRWNGPGDLPNDIDLVARRSTDQGDTWSEPVTIADFGTAGAADAALVLDRSTGDLLCLFGSHVGLFQSTHANPIRFQVARSQDNGITWSAPTEHTSEIYAPTWQAAWIASGNACQLRSGRIVGAVGVRQTSGNAISNFMIYSDDGGDTWNYKPAVASSVGDEAKIAELDNGDLMMNIRNQTPDRRRIVTSTNGGDSWSPPSFQQELIDPFVNGELIRYTSVLDGYDQSRLLFSIAADPSVRRNLTIFLSYDEGATWPVSRTIYTGLSAYSSLTVLDDGTIGCFYENGEYDTYQLYFARFSLDWLTHGADHWEAPTSVQEADGSGALLLEVMPNPAKGEATVQFELREADDLTAVLIDAKGQVVDTLFQGPFSAGAHRRSINLGGLASGSYVVEVVGRLQGMTRRMVVLE
ncbi:MAG: exo-alpha-sialidase [Flavobacteriales bacterium]|nr:exo-alpha-sialidase [Flavobacteriales bacterium]